MKSLFPEMDKELAEDRKAARQEEVQRARDRLRGQDLSWLINYLLEKGPSCEHTVMLDLAEGEYHFEDRVKLHWDVLNNLLDLWITRKLWRTPLGKHFGSGEESYLYGIRGVHKRNHVKTPIKP